MWSETSPTLRDTIERELEGFGDRGVVILSRKRVHIVSGGLVIDSNLNQYKSVNLIATESKLNRDRMCPSRRFGSIGIKYT